MKYLILAFSNTPLRKSLKNIDIALICSCKSIFKLSIVLGGPPREIK